MSPAFKVYSSLPAIYSLVPSIDQLTNKFQVYSFFKSTVSSDIIGMLGVSLIT